MQNSRILAGFLLRAVVVGLAVAFLVVWWKPALLGAVTVPAPASGTAPAPQRTVVVMQSFADSVARAAPAVVNIYTARVITERSPPAPLDQLFGDYWPSYRRHVERSLGSGVIVNAKGTIVTNQHVIAGADSIRVQLADGRIAEATVVGQDPDTDIAILDLSIGNLPVMPLGRSDTLRAGDIVLAIGNPYGLSQTVTQGIVSATGRGQLGLATFENFIQTDAAINLGNSGGALIDVHGDLVGINTAVLNRAYGGPEGIGFAIPVNLVRGVMEQILAHGHVVRIDLAHHKDVLAPPRDGLADDLFGAALGVHLRTVDECHAEVQAPAQGGDLLRAVATSLAHVPRAHAQRGHVRAGAQGNVRQQGSHDRRGRAVRRAYLRLAYCGAG